MAVDRSGEAGVEVRKDELEAFGFSAKEALFFGCR